MQLFLVQWGSDGSLNSDPNVSSHPKCLTKIPEMFQILSCGDPQNATPSWSNTKGWKLCGTVYCGYAYLDRTITKGTFHYLHTVLSMIRISIRSAATTSTFLVIRLRQVLLQFCFKIRGEGYWMPKFFQTLYCRIHVFQKRHAFLPLHTPHWPTGCWYQQMVLSNIVDALSFLVTHSKSRHEFTFDTLNNHLPSLWLQCWMAFA